MTVQQMWDYQTREVTDVTEEEVLREVGEEGWELIDLGRMAVHLRRPHDMSRHTQWEYTQHSGTLNERTRQRLLEEGWQPAIHSSVMHYFKRTRGIQAHHEGFSPIEPEPNR